MTLTCIKSEEKGSYHDQDFPVVRKELTHWYDSNGV